MDHGQAAGGRSGEARTSVKSSVTGLMRALTMLRIKVGSRLGTTARRGGGTGLAATVSLR